MQQNKLNKSYKLIFTSQLTLQKANEEYLNEKKRNVIRSKIKIQGGPYVHYHCVACQKPEIKGQ